VPEATATLPLTSTDDPDVVLFSGPLHVITYMGDHVRDMTQRSPIGDPVRLAFVNPALRATQAAMDRVYETGVSEDVVNTYGPVRLCALTEGHADITRILRCSSCQSPRHCLLDESHQLLVPDEPPA
jgi:hypothetical protein